MTPSKQKFLLVLTIATKYGGNGNSPIERESCFPPYQDYKTAQSSYPRRNLDVESQVYIQVCHVNYWRSRSSVIVWQSSHGPRAVKISSSVNASFARSG
jgi:hypothetical protein